jgi:pimeloyl-ACP methyl ester carboxylesterase/AraC-like DNA-binding protein
MVKPSTHYTRSGRINIAYQAFGTGNIDLVYVPGWVSNIDLMWDCPQLVTFLEGLAKIARVILFDKRGTGLSDRVTELSPIEDRMDDIRAVMDAVGSEKAVLFGHSEGGSVSALFAATYPERTIALITFGVFAKRRWSPDYPWAPSDEERQQVYDMIEHNWGGGKMDLASLAPSMSDDQAFMDWLARYFRSGASPSAALALTKMNTEVDIIDILPFIRIPSLFMCRTGDVDVKVEESKFMAAQIRGAKVVEFTGNDHLFWAGNSTEVLQEMIRFLVELDETPDFERKLATLLAMEVYNPLMYTTQQGEEKWEATKEKIDTLLSKLVKQYRGNLIRHSDYGVLAAFDGPSKAVHCSIDIREAFKAISIRARQGIHIGECAFSSPYDEISEQAISLTGKIMQRALPNQILISQTVENLLSGTGLSLGYHSQLTDTSINKPMVLKAVDERAELRKEEVVEIIHQDVKKNHSLLEDVLQSIEDHLDDEQYSIQVLCSEVGISERQLQRKLKSITNKTPNQLVRSVRLHRAKEMIMQQHKTISEVAFMTGFNSISYFTKCFKKEFGLAPSDL